MFADLLGVNFGTLADLKLPPQKISNIPSPLALLSPRRMALWFREGVTDSYRIVGVTDWSSPLFRTTCVSQTFTGC